MMATYVGLTSLIAFSNMSKPWFSSSSVITRGNIKRRTFFKAPHGIMIRPCSRHLLIIYLVCSEAGSLVVRFVTNSTPTILPKPLTSPISRYLPFMSSSRDLAICPSSVALYCDDKPLFPWLSSLLHPCVRPSVSSLPSTSRIWAS